MIQSIKKAMDIVDHIAQKGRASIKELSTKMGMHKSTVCRLAQSLEATGYLEQDPISGEYLLSYKFYRAGYDMLEKSGIRTCVLPVVKRLHEITGDTVNFSVLDDSKVLYLEKAESSPIHGGIGVGSRGPIHCTASGKIMLANLSTERVKAILEMVQPLEAYTEKTIVTADALFEELAKCRNQGYATECGEIGNGADAVGAFVKNYPGGKAAAISIAAPEIRFANGRLNELIKLIVSAADEISGRFMVL